jgi:hypothetical protein
MNDQDKEHLEAIYVGFAMVGFLMNGDYSVEEIPSLSKKLAAAMMEPESTIGLPAIKKRIKK